MADSPLSNTLLGQCPDCCTPCGQVESLPDALYVTFSGVAGCSCAPSGPNSFSTDIAAINGTFALTRSSPLVWGATNFASGTHHFYPGVTDCSGVDIPIDTNLSATVSATEDGMGNCILTILVTDSAAGANMFLGTLTLPADSIFDPASNTTDCSFGPSASGGTATLSA